MHDAEQTVQRECGYGVYDKAEQTWAIGVVPKSSRNGLQGKLDDICCHYCMHRNTALGLAA